MSDDPVTPVSAQTEELRFATAMTGGVSLAIWMGGVARELNLVQRASQRRDELASLPDMSPTGAPDENVETLYLRLLNLLDTTVEADILAGTSAGGINAALLGMARVNDLDLAPLRDMWLKLGALEDLLRDPAEDDPPSLLQGDGHLLKGLEAGFDELWPASTPVAGSWRATIVHLTTTLLAGEVGRFTDAYGTLVEDIDHRGLFTFDEGTLSDRGVLPALATAARSTASFPGAFEPGFVAHGEGTGRPAMEQYSNITRAHWVSDGGLLMNRPIQPLLQAVFDRKAERHVRRVLLYVVPSAGKQPDPVQTPKPVVLDEPLSLAEAVLDDVQAVMQQSIAAELKAIDDHNDRVDSLLDTRLRMARIGTRLRAVPARPVGGHAPLAGSSLVDQPMFDDFCRRQSDWFVRPVVRALMREISSRPEEELEAWKEELAPGTAIEASCQAAAAAAIAEGWVIRNDPELPWHAPLRAFGLAAYDGAKGTAVSILRVAFALAETDGRRADLARVLDSVHHALGDAGAERFARPRVRDVVRRRLTPLPSGPLPQVAADLALAYRQELDAAAGDLDAAWSALAGALHGAAGGLEELAGSAGDARARDVLQSYVAFLFDGAADAATIATRLFELHVATRSVLPVAVDVEQPVQLVQVSSNTRTLLAPDLQTAHAKLTGMQFHHFGAFYKSSWRANDWAWGRIDGAGWLAHLLLDPRRIRAVAPQTSGEAFYQRLCTAIGAEDRAGPERNRILKELRFLEGDDTPTSLPNTAQWVAREIQRWIAAEELPVVAREMHADGSPPDPWATKVQALSGAVDRPKAVRLAAAMQQQGIATESQADRLVDMLTTRPAPVGPLNIAMGDLLATCPVPAQKLEHQVGRPLMTRTITKAAAVAGAMANAGEPPIGMLRAPLGALRTVTMGAYRVVTSTGGRAAPLLLIGGAALVIGLLLAVEQDSLFGFAGAVIFAVGLLLITVVTWGGHSKKVRQGVVGALVLGAVVAFASARESLFGEARYDDKRCSSDDIGWFGCEVLPWLASSFWRPVLVLGVFAALAAGIGALGAQPWSAKLRALLASLRQRSTGAGPAGKFTER